MTEQEDIGKENLEDFVLKNEERILEILQSGRSKVKTRVDSQKDKGKAIMKGMVEAMMDREVTEHFMSMGVEMILGVSAFIKALPLPEELDPFVKAVSEQKDMISEIMCKKNPVCKNVEKEERLEKIELE